MTLLIYAVAAVILFLITFLSTHERISPLPRKKPPSPGTWGT